MSQFLSLAQIREAIQRLGKFHPFFGTTFLVLKRNEAPIGQTMRLSLDAENRELLRRHYRPHPKSDHFFLPFQKRKNENHWRKPKYASGTLQAVNTQAFTPGALLHQKDEKDWGWAPGYLQFLACKLPKGQKLPLLHLAVWFGREEAWEDSISRADIVKKFVSDYHLTADEVSTLFDSSISSALSEDGAFQSTPVKWDRIIEGFGTPEDVPPEGSAILHFLEFSGLGPARRLIMPPAARLNVVTGDNGLGKTFILDIVWWALTQEWAEHMLVPLGPVATPPQIKFTVSSAREQKPVTAVFNLAGYNWEVPAPEAVSGLVIYARVDGSFAVWDPANPNLSSRGSSGQPRFVSFTREEIWKGDGNKIDGLLRDWVRWQTRPDEFPAFTTFEKVVQRTKPPDLGEFSMGKPERIQGWPIEIPTLVHPYGTVPIVYESAGIRRILTLAYLIVWAWEEHKIQAKAAGRKEERQMVILLDEAEAHLHPRWQRVLLPALLGIANDLHEELAIQYFIATHSPLVLASAEPVWDAFVDKLFHLRMNANGKVIFDSVPFELRGTADSWLQSPSFDGLHPGSEPAAEALRQAKALLKTPNVTTEQVRAASDKLAQHIAAEDPFWLRWLLFAAQHGVEL